MSEFLTRNKLLSVHKHPKFPLFAFILCLILVADLLFLNYKIIIGSSNIPFLPFIAGEKKAPAISPQSTVITKGEDACGQNCKEEIRREVAAAIPSQNSAAPAPTDNKASVKEYFIPFGTGYASSTDWFDVPGMQVAIDGSAYGKIKQTNFEVSIRVPTGNESVDVQLFNVTAGHPVWNSAISYSGGTASGVLFSVISLDPGTNVYKVQMRTQLASPAYLDQARVHVVTY